MININEHTVLYMYFNLGKFLLLENYYLFIYLFVYLFIYLSIYLFIYIYSYLLNYLYTYLFIYLFICLYIYLARSAFNAFDFMGRGFIPANDVGEALKFVMVSKSEKDKEAVMKHYK